MHHSGSIGDGFSNTGWFNAKTVPSAVAGDVQNTPVRGGIHGLAFNIDSRSLAMADVKVFGLKNCDTC